MKINETKCFLDGGKIHAIQFPEIMKNKTNQSASSQEKSFAVSFNSKANVLF